MKGNQEPDTEAHCDCATPPRIRSPQSNRNGNYSPIAPDSPFEEKCKVLRASTVDSGPNAFRRQSSFGSTTKMKPTKKGQSAIKVEKGDYYSHAENVDNWQKNNHLGNPSRRINIVDSFGKLMVQPGPLDYRPKTEKRSTQRADPHWSFYDRDKYGGSVDAVNVPGPGSYPTVPCIVPKEPYIVRQEKTKIISAMEKVGPGSYEIRRTAEMATQRFHRETAACMAKRDLGSKTRDILDFNTLKIKKNKQKRLKNAEKNKIYDEKSHLGPGAYFPLKSELPNCVTTVPNQTLPRRKKYDYDPNIPSTPVHKFGERRQDLSLGKDQETPGPGEYDYLASLYGSQPLLEGGGSVSRPGKGTSNTTDSEGTVKGQHVNIDFATKHIPAIPTMKSIVKVNGKMSSGYWASNREKKLEREKKYKSPYATSHKKVQRIQRLVGRVTESTAQDLPFRFSGRQSTGCFFQFHS